MSKTPSVAQCIAAFVAVGLSEAAAREILKTNKVYSFSGLEALVAANTPVVEAPVKKVRKARSSKVNTAGPRGFRFGAVWNQSVLAGKGVALRTANLPKLQAQAETFGVEAETQEELVAAVATKLAA